MEQYTTKMHKSLAQLHALIGPERAGQLVDSVYTEIHMLDQNQLHNLTNYNITTTVNLAKCYVASSILCQQSMDGRTSEELIDRLVSHSRSNGWLE